MLLHAEQSVLLVVDIQEKLVAAVYEAPRLVASVKWLIDAAVLNHVPVIFSEQYPQGLGATLPVLRNAAPSGRVVSKTAFSCVGAHCLPESEWESRPQIVVCGMEAHVCVLQTALELTAAGHQVFLAADAIGSRNDEDRLIALDRARQAGIAIISREMALFEWVRDSRAPHFRDISKQLLMVPPTLAFADILTTLPRVDKIASLQLWRDGKLDSVIEHREGQLGSLAVYHVLFKRFGAITPKAARLGQWLYGEHADDARLHPGKHPNIDRLFALEATGGGFGVKLIPQS